MRLDGNKLQRARERLGYSLELVGTEAGVSKNSVLRAEHEEDIRPGTARKIAEALGVEVAELIADPKGFRQPLTLERARAGDIDESEIEAASTEELRDLVKGLYGNRPAKTLDDLRELQRERRLAEDALQNMREFNQAQRIGEELVRRGEESPEEYLQDLRQYLDALDFG